MDEKKDEAARAEEWSQLQERHRRALSQPQSKRPFATDEVPRRGRRSKVKRPEVYRVRARKLSPAEKARIKSHQAKWARARVLRKRRVLAEIKFHQAVIASLQADLKAGRFFP